MRNKGIAIVLALATVLVVSGIGTLIFTRTIREIRHGAQDQGVVQTLMRELHGQVGLRQQGQQHRDRGAGPCPRGPSAGERGGPLPVRP